MEATATAERLFGRALHSEADRQALIKKKARSIAQHIKSAISKDKSELHEIASRVFTEMEEETQGFVLLAMLTGDIAAIRSAQLMITTEYQKAVDTTAELRAIAEVEAMTPADFER